MYLIGVFNPAARGKAVVVESVVFSYCALADTFSMSHALTVIGEQGKCIEFIRSKRHLFRNSWHDEGVRGRGRRSCIRHGRRPRPDMRAGKKRLNVY